MTLSEALEEVGRFYVPGVAAFYEKQSPNPWQQAHDDLEQAVLTANELVMHAAAGAFAIQCKNLIDAFIATGIRKSGISARDGFYMNDVSRVDSARSRKSKECSVCHNRTNLKIESLPSGGVHVVCGDCSTNGEQSREIPLHMVRPV